MCLESGFSTTHECESSATASFTLALTAKIVLPVPLRLQESGCLYVKRLKRPSKSGTISKYIGAHRSNRTRIFDEVAEQFQSGIARAYRLENELALELYDASRG